MKSLLNISLDMTFKFLDVCQKPCSKFRLPQACGVTKWDAENCVKFLLSRRLIRYVPEIVEGVREASYFTTPRGTEVYGMIQDVYNVLAGT